VKIRPDAYEKAIPVPIRFHVDAQGEFVAFFKIRLPVSETGRITIPQPADNINPTIRLIFFGFSKLPHGPLLAFLTNHREGAANR